MSKVKMIAADTFHATSVRAEPLRPDERFEASSEAEAKDLEDRGLARRVEPWTDGPPTRKVTKPRG